MTEHRERRFVPYSAEQMFELVGDVGRYPEFLPWCLASRVRPRTPGDTDHFEADVLIGFRMVRETFTSRVALIRPTRIDVDYAEGPFRCLRNHWSFTPAEGGCIIDFYVEFEFRSRVLQALIGAVFNEAARRMVGSFEDRAAQLYGHTSASPAEGMAPS